MYNWGYCTVERCYVAWPRFRASINASSMGLLLRDRETNTKITKGLKPAFISQPHKTYNDNILWRSHVKQVKTWRPTVRQGNVDVVTFSKIQKGSEKSLRYHIHPIRKNLVDVMTASNLTLKWKCWEEVGENDRYGEKTDLSPAALQGKFWEEGYLVSNWEFFWETHKKESFMWHGPSQWNLSLSKPSL